jgi:hypothetical protein
MIEIPMAPQPPDAWLAIHCYADGTKRVCGIYSSTDDHDLFAMVADLPHWSGYPGLFLTRDHPLLDVIEHGILISNPACLSARQNWFNRFASVLEGHLRDPVPTQVFTFAEGKLADACQTHRSTVLGPFPLPTSTSWPTCGLCGSKLAFLGVLDFRQLLALKLPGDALVLHACKECGYPADLETHSAIWLTLSKGVEIVSDAPHGKIEVGTRWNTMDYPIPEELSATGPFQNETGTFFNFSCFATKVGGRPFWIQSDEIPNDSSGQRMEFLGHWWGTDETEIGDCGLAYLFYSTNTNETAMITQCF